MNFFPCLLVLIFIIFAGFLIYPVGKYGVPLNDYSSNPLIKGFLDGYLTMDTIAALNFGIIISLNIKAKGIQEENSVVKETIKAGWIAGVILLFVYASLAHIGALSSKMPFYDIGLGWIIPSIIGIFFGILISIYSKKNNVQSS